MAFCIASDMFAWATRAKPLAGDPFLSYPSWALSREFFNNRIKTTATVSGFDATRFSTHSCRMGGATLLAAAGHPNHYIQHAGRWRSMAFLEYITWAVESMEAALVSLVDPTLFTNIQMVRLNPSAIAC